MSQGCHGDQEAVRDIHFVSMIQALNLNEHKALLARRRSSDIKINHPNNIHKGTIIHGPLEH